MTTHVVSAPAKVNLHLNVVGRRADGFHLLDSLAAFCCLSDSISVEEQERLALTVEGPFADRLGHPDDNLVLKAARTLSAAAKADRGAHIRLQKRIPVAAGLGGGSADAAAVLLALNDCWGLGWNLRQIDPIARDLGADVPMCLACRPARVGGVGDILAPCGDLPSCGILLANSGIPVPTAGVFQSFAAANTRLAPLPSRVWPRVITLNELTSALAERGNDLIPAATAFDPNLKTVLDQLAELPGALYCSMSGSGGTCFALFAGETLAMRAASLLSERRPGWWCYAGRLLTAAEGLR